MEALNKKIPENQMVSFLNSFSFPEITVAVLSASVLQAFFQLSGYMSGIFAALVSLIFLSVLHFYPRPGLLLISLISFLTLESGTPASLIIMAGVSAIIANLVLSSYSERFSLMLLATLTHVGDAFTTYIGIRKGLREVNPLIDLIIDNFGSISIFGVKAVILPVIIYSYLKLPEKESKLLLKIIYVVGLYLTVSNALVYFS
ncbi:MAG: DUF5658 family protein [Candidatus Nanohaloarchaea archaeon]